MTRHDESGESLYSTPERRRRALNPAGAFCSIAIAPAGARSSPLPLYPERSVVAVSAA
ncbi:MAG: hypothetical protein QHG99_05470 [Methanomicrobiales archaeon]|nr:hypothetical protein [Methanomicrobiales archaeon]